MLNANVSVACAVADFMNFIIRIAMAIGKK